jgi:hypothetical protein
MRTQPWLRDDDGAGPTSPTSAFCAAPLTTLLPVTPLAPCCGCLGDEVDERIHELAINPDLEVEVGPG